MNRTISLRQTGMIVVMMILANKILLLPSLLYKTVKTDGVFVVVSLFLIDLLVLGIFIKLKLAYPNQKLLDVLNANIGKIATKIIYTVFMVFFLFKVFLTYSIAFMYLKQQVYQNEFTIIAIIAVLPVINHAVLSGLRTFSRTIELFYYIAVGLFMTCLIIALGSFKQTPSFFVAQPGDFGLALVKNVFSFGDYLFLFLVMDKIELEKKDIKKLLKFVFFGIFLVLSLFFIYYSIYQVTSFMHNYAIADILTITVEFNAIGRLDIVAMVTIMLLSLFQMMIFHYAFSECFVGVFNKLNKIFSVAVFDVLFLLIYYILIGRYEVMVTYVETWLPYFAMVADYLVPIVFFGISCKKGEKSTKNNKKVEKDGYKGDYATEFEGEEVSEKSVMETIEIVLKQQNQKEEKENAENDERQTDKSSSVVKERNSAKLSTEK
jgi:hypothetical protein